MLLSMNLTGVRGQNAWGGHKGNCKNPIHKQKSVMKFYNLDSKCDSVIFIDSIINDRKTKRNIVYYNNNKFIMQ